jgi:hypothetical protein
MALVLALGGAIVTILAVWLAELFIGASTDGRLIDSIGFGDLLLVIIALALPCAAGAYALRRMGWNRKATLCALTTWLVGYLFIWIIGAQVGGMSLPLYLVLWLGIGVAGSRLFDPPGDPMSVLVTIEPENDTRPRTATERFGRIPPATVERLRHMARLVDEEVVTALPVEAPTALRQYTVRTVLDYCLRDWWENKNSRSLRARDVCDLRSFVSLAVSLAGGADEAVPTVYHAELAATLRSPEVQAIYRAVLDALLGDWLTHWNEYGLDGPPV